MSSHLALNSTLLIPTLLVKMSVDKKFLGDFFPTRQSAAVFVGYIVFFIAQAILVKASQTNRHYAYNVTCVVMLTEVFKLIVSTGIYLKDHNFTTLLGDVSRYRHVLLLYFVPALLYCFYNNLAFHNLQTFDPTTYNLLMQFRVVITGIVFQLLFRKRLSGQQWCSLCLLTVGCIIKQFSVAGPPAPEASLGAAPMTSIDGGGGPGPEGDAGDDGGGAGAGEGAGGVAPLTSVLLSWAMLSILFQMLCSCLAGVYNEFLLKDTGADMHIMVHNVFMYIDSIVCNLVMLAWNGDVGLLVDRAALGAIFGQPLVVLIIVNGSLCGIIVSVFLRSLNSILKTFAGALDLSFTAVLCWLVFGIPVDLATVVAITVVSIATYLYSQNPVVNHQPRPKEAHANGAAMSGGKDAAKQLAEDKQVLLAQDV